MLENVPDGSPESGIPAYRHTSIGTWPHWPSTFYSEYNPNVQSRDPVYSLYARLQYIPVLSDARCQLYCQVVLLQPAWAIFVI